MNRLRGNSNDNRRVAFSDCLDRFEWSLSIQLRNWAMSKPQLHLSVMPEALMFPDDGLGTRLALTVFNRGGGPTIITHMTVSNTIVDGSDFAANPRWPES